MDRTLGSPGNHPSEGNHAKKPMGLSGSDIESAFWPQAIGLEIQMTLARKLRLTNRDENITARAVAMLDESCPERG